MGSFDLDSYVAVEAVASDSPSPSPALITFDYIAGMIVSITCILMNIYVFLSFTYRVYQGGHQVTYVALLGSTISLISNTCGILGKYIPIPILLCGISGRALGLGLGGLAAMTLVLHYTLKARLLNIIPNSWTVIQKICLAGVFVIPWTPIVAVFLIEERALPNGLCAYTVPWWLTISGGLTSVWVNMMPSLCFLGPLVTAWGRFSGQPSDGKIRTQWMTLLYAIRGKTSDGRNANNATSRESVLNHGSGRSSQYGGHGIILTDQIRSDVGLQSNQSVHATPMGWRKSVLPTEGNRKSYVGGQGMPLAASVMGGSTSAIHSHSILQPPIESTIGLRDPTISTPSTTTTTTTATSTSSIQSKSPHTSSRPGDTKRAKQAKIVRRVFLASVGSSTTTQILALLAIVEFIGPEFVASLYPLDQAVGWFFAVVALPLPAEKEGRKERRGSETEERDGTRRATVRNVVGVAVRVGKKMMM